MRRIIYVMAIFAALIATPALAADADLHAAHHPQTAATPAPKPAPENKPASPQTGMACPMMQGGSGANGMMMQGSGAKAMECPMMKAQPKSK